MTLPLFVLAGGFGTRLQSVLNGFPKALAPVNGKHFLSLQIEHWVKQGVDSFVFLLHHHADTIINFLKTEESNLLKDCKVSYIVEPKPMGTGGAVAYAIELLAFEGDFLLANADTWIGQGVDEMMNNSSPAILVVKVRDTGRYGEVIFNDHNLVTAFDEKRNCSTTGWINAGISRMNSSLFKSWDGQPFSLENSTFPNLVKNKALVAISLDTDFIDIGIPEDYARFCRWIESNKTIEL